MKKRIKTILFVLCALTLSSLTHAQESPLPSNETQTSFHGFYNTTDLGLLVGSSKNNLRAPFSFMTVAGYHITQKFAVGVGIGSDFLEESYIPLVLDLRYYFRTSSFSPYIFIQGGYSISTENDKYSQFNYWLDYSPINSFWPHPTTTLKPEGGFLINPGFGIRKMFSDNFGLTFTVSYRFQQLNYNESDGSHIDSEYNRMNIRMGIIFK